MSSQSTQPQSQSPESLYLSAERQARWDRQTAVLAASLVVVLVGLVLALFWLYSSTLVMSGVETMGVSLGGVSRRAATDLLQQAWSDRAVVLHTDGASWVVPAHRLGLSLDTEATVNAALSAGTPARRAQTLLRGTSPLRVAPVVTVDPPTARSYLDALAPQVNVTPSGATLAVVSGHAEVRPGTPGRALDAADTLARLTGAAGRVADEGRLALEVQVVPPVAVDLNPAVEAANAWLANSVAIRAYDPITDESLWWTAPPEVWGSWVRLEADTSSPVTFGWTLDPEPVRAYLSGQAAALDQERYIDLHSAVGSVEAALASQSWNVVVRVWHHPSQHVVQQGETLASIARHVGFPYPWLQQANPGVDALRPGQVLNVPSPDALLPLPIVAHKRIVVSISQQRMWAYEWGKLVWAWTVSTGIESSPTSPGVFQVQSHEPNAYAGSWDLWMPHFLGIYRPVPGKDFMNGFHGFPTRDGANLLWMGSLGHPVTYGCILLSTQNASVLYQWAEAGVVVEIQS